MKKLWLTYAWKDNEAEQVDYVIQMLRAQGLEVGFDRARLIAGQRLWSQLDANISDAAKSDAWAIYATKNSLSSEPCLEEVRFQQWRCSRPERSHCHLAQADSATRVDGTRDIRQHARDASSP